MEVELKQDPMIPESQQAAPEKKSRKKPVLIIGIVLVAVAAIAFLGYKAYSASTNSYKTPVAIMEEQANDRSYKSDVDRAYKSLNGFAGKEAAAIMELVTNSEGYLQSLEEEQWFFDEAVGFNKKEYGEDWKIRYKIKGKETLDEVNLDEFKNRLAVYCQELMPTLEEGTELNGCLLEYMRQMQTVQVAEGYELTLLQITTGNKVTEAVEQEMTVKVYLVDGRWVAEDALISFISYASWYATKI